MVIVAGMPKSGTTAIVELLGAATGKVICSDPFHQLDKRKVSFREKLYEGDLSLRDLWVRNRRVFSGVFIKDPNFPFLLAEIRNIFPDAKQVFIIRDPRDNIRSILNRLKLPGNPKHGSLDLIRNNIAWTNLLTGRYPNVPGNSYIEILSWRWKLAAEAFLKYHKYGIVIRYEDFNKNKSTSIFQLASQLGYSNLQSIEHLVDIQYQPKGDKTIPIDVFFDEASLKSIDNITGPVMKKFGYEPYNVAH